MEEEDSLYSRKHKPLSIMERAQEQNVTKAVIQENGAAEEKQPDAQPQPTEQTA